MFSIFKYMYSRVYFIETPNLHWLLLPPLIQMSALYSLLPSKPQK